MTERDACALLKARFEQAGYTIAQSVPFDEDGVRFELDGFDAARRVGYEYLTEEAGDGWDVDGQVIAALEARRDAGELFILVVDEKDAADAAALGRAADVFLAQLAELDEEADDEDEGEEPAPAKKPAAKAPAKKSAAKKPAAKPLAKKPAAKKPAAKKPAARKPATKPKKK